MNLASELLRPVIASPDERALVDATRQITFRELQQRAAGVAAQLRQQAISENDRVVLMGDNSIEYAIAYLGVLWMGAVAVPINPKATSHEITQLLQVVNPSAVLHLPGIPADLSIDVPILHLDLEQPLENVPFATRTADDLAVLLFTSGTAGLPKAAMLSHGNLGSNLASVRSSEALTPHPGDIGFAALPWFHIFGLNVGLSLGLAAGVPTVVADAFNPAQCLELVKEKQVTILAVVPALLRLWLDLPNATAEHFASVRLCVSGAAPLDDDLAEMVRDRFGMEVHNGYGLTEASPIVTTSAMGDARSGSIGLPIPGVEVRLVDSDGEPALPGDAGEIWVRGSNVFQGYWNDSDATAAVLVDGWLKTGDAATSDDDGYLYMVDRLKDLIIVSGFNVYPAEVEAVLLDHPRVLEAGVIGVPDDRTGERVHAVVVLDQTIQPTPTAEDLVGWCRDHLSRYKCPHQIQIVDSLPKSINGKVLRRSLREQ